MLNAIWVGFFVMAFAMGLVQMLFLDRPDIFVEIMKSTFDMAKVGFEIALGLTGVMTLWLGLMRIGERAGFMEALTRAMTPLFRRLFPEVPAGHPALGGITMNMPPICWGWTTPPPPWG